MSEPAGGPGDVLSQAAALLNSSGGVPVAVRERAAALLARQALEEALAAYWRHRSPEMVNCPARAQIRCVEPPSVEQQASACWTGLSRACHHHPYELAPAVTEVSAALEAVRDVCQALGGGGSHRP